MVLMSHGFTFIKIVITVYTHRNVLPVNISTCNILRHAGFPHGDKVRWISAKGTSPGECYRLPWHFRGICFYEDGRSDHGSSPSRASFSLLPTNQVAVLLLLELWETGLHLEPFHRPSYSILYRKSDPLFKL